MHERERDRPGGPRLGEGLTVPKNTRRALLVVWIVVIFVLTGFPMLEVPEVDNVPIDKLYHFLVFFVMGLLGANLLDRRVFFLLGSGVVLLAECQQLFIPGRRFEWLDMIAGAAGFFVSFLVFRKRGERREL